MDRPPDDIAGAVHRHLAPDAERIAVVERHANGSIAIETENAGWDVEPMPLPEGTPFRVVRVRPYEWSDPSALVRTMPALALLDDGRSFDSVSVEGMAGLVEAMRGCAAAALARMIVTHHRMQPGIQFVIESDDQIVAAVRERAREIVHEVKPRWTSADVLEFVSARLVDVERRAYELRAWSVSVKADGVLWQSRPIIGDLDEGAFRHT